MKNWNEVALWVVLGTLFLATVVFGESAYLFSSRQMRIAVPRLAADGEPQACTSETVPLAGAKAGDTVRAVWISEPQMTRKMEIEATVQHENEAVVKVCNTLARPVGPVSPLYYLIVSRPDGAAWLHEQP